MVEVTPISIDGHWVTSVSVKLPKTNLLIVTTEKGYIMCGALDVSLLNNKLAERKVVAGRALGVRSIEQLLEAPLESVTDAATELGIQPGMKGREAVLKML
ncbi:MAG: DUF1805 domain-containing protein [Bacillaceae bacterium]|nr:DUF1805 domain-containing protein [Bacillaceae bacterium]